MITQAPRGTADWYGDAMAKRERADSRWYCRRPDPQADSGEAGI